MTDSDAALRELRREYVRDAPARFDRVTEIVGRLRRHPSDTDALAGLRRAFHSLAGSGATYGFPEVSRLSGRDEEECAAMVQGGVPSLDDLERWQAVVDMLREHPPGKARGARMPGVCKRRATQPGGMPRRPE